jgi:AcrR family transcriptional regulator
MAASTPVSGSSPHVQEKRQRRQAEILGAAMGAFRARGYHSTTLEDIADRLGVRKTALYHYFPDKDAILFACHKQSLAELSGHLAAARRAYPTATARLRHIILEHVRVMTDSGEESPLAFDVPALSPPLQQKVIQARDRYERSLRRIIAEGVRSGEFRPVDPKIAVFVMLGAINWIARWYQPSGTMDPGAIAQQFADHLLGGLVCPPQP